MSDVVGWAAHARGGGPVAGVVRRDSRWARRCGWPSGRRTCSAHRSRVQTRPASTSPGSRGVVAVDVAPTAPPPPTSRACAPTRTSSTSPCRAGYIPYVVPQLRSITLGGAVTGLGHRVDVVPQRAAARVRARDGRAHRRRAGASPPDRATTCSTRSPTPTARSATRPGCGSGSSRCPAYVDLRHVRFDDLDALAKTIERDRRAAASTTASGSTGWTAWCSRRGRPTSRWRPGTDSRSAAGTAAPRTTPGMRAVLPVAPASARPTRSPCTTTCGAGTPTGSGAPARSACRTRRVRRLWPRRWRRSDVYHRLVGLENRFGVMARIDRARGKPARERVIQDIEVPVERTAGVRALVRRARRDAAGVAVPAARDPGPGRRTRSRPGATYVNVGFWGTVADRARRRATATRTAPSRPRSPRSAATSRCTPTPTTTGRPSTGSTASPTSAGSSSRPTRTTGSRASTRRR